MINNFNFEKNIRKKYKYIYMMNSYKNYIDVLRSILKNFDDNQFDDIIKNILIKIFDVYFLERDI